MRKIYFVKFLNTGYLYRYRTVQFVAVAVAGTEAGATEIGGTEPEPQHCFIVRVIIGCLEVFRSSTCIFWAKSQSSDSEIYTYTGYTLHSYNENCIKHFLLRKKLIR